MSDLNRKLDDLTIEESDKPEHKSVGRYEIIEELGSGTYGKVIRAHDRKSGKEVAIKKLKFEEPVKYIFRELVCLKINNHPHLLHLLDTYVPLKTTSAETLDEIYFVTECMNRSLEDLIYRTETVKLTQENITFITYQIFCGVNHLHKSGIIHRDLKSDNIGITETYQVKILDFGISRQILPKMTTNPGCKNYQAPEIAQQKRYNEKADVWSVGCILSELLRTKPPVFHNEAIQKQLEDGVFKFSTYFDTRLFQNYTNFNNLEITSQLSAENARDLLSKLLVVDPQQRFSALQAINHPYLCIYKQPDEVDVTPPLIPFNLHQQPTKELLYETIVKFAEELHLNSLS